MTNKEFSNAFDVMLSSYAYPSIIGEESSNQVVVLDEYEKSLFLTQAQEDLVLSLYTGKNSAGDIFEGTEEMRRHLSDLVYDAEENPIVNSIGHPIGGNKSVYFTLPEDLWFILYEQVKIKAEDNSCSCIEGGIIDVYPVKHDEYHRIKRNPFRGATNRRALRLDLAYGVIEIISPLPVNKYIVRYLRKLTPIILEDLPDGLTINEESKNTECILHESLHNKILELAVYKAIQSKGLYNNKENK